MFLSRKILIAKILDDMKERETSETPYVLQRPDVSTSSEKKEILASNSLRVPAQMDINCRGHWRTCWVNPNMNMQDFKRRGSRPIARNFAVTSKLKLMQGIPCTE